MAYRKRERVLAEDFNGFLTQIARVYGTGAGDVGYGQTTIAPPSDALQGDRVRASDWAAIRAMAAAIGQHQDTTLADLPPLSAFVTNAVITAHTPLDGNRYDLPGSLSSLYERRANVRETQIFDGRIRDTRTTTWGRTTSQTIFCRMDATFPSEDAARWFFNGGGRIRMSLTQSGLVTPKDSDWATTLGRRVAVATMGARGSDRSGTHGTPTALGYWGLTGEEQPLYMGQGIHPDGMGSVLFTAQRVGPSGVRGGNGATIRFTLYVQDANPTLPDMVNPPLHADFGYSIANTNFTFASPVFTVAVPFDLSAPAQPAMLPTIEATIIDADEDVGNQNIDPPTQEAILSDWTRIAANDIYYTGDTIPDGSEAAAWRFNSISQRIESTTNSASVVGFLSAFEVENYEHQVTIGSTHVDDDLIGVVVAFRRVNGTNHTLVALRNQASGYFLGTGVAQYWCLMEFAGNSARMVSPGGSKITSAAGWANYGPTRIRVRRVGLNVEITTSQQGNLSLDQTTTIAWTMPEDSIYAGPASYGYLCRSQAASYFTNISLTGTTGSAVIYDLRGGDANADVLIFNGSYWAVSPDRTPWGDLGYPRLVRNPDTGKTFLLDGPSPFTATRI